MELCLSYMDNIKHLLNKSDTVLKLRHSYVVISLEVHIIRQGNVKNTTRFSTGATPQSNRLNCVGPRQPANGYCIKMSGKQTKNSLKPKCKSFT